ncbi:MAG: flagellar filament capping protein FliD [Vicinamibacterales bacterium]
MGSPITLSGFNNIDFNSILTALMKQERLPVTLLESQQTAIKSKKSTFSALASRLATLESATDALDTGQSLQGRAASVSDASALSVSPGSSTPLGSYEVVVKNLARAQVTTTSSTHANSDTTVVASGGTLTIGGVAVTVTGDVTLDGLAAAINNTTNIGATASVVKNGSNYQLVLTGRDTGQAHAFTITNGLTGGSGVAFSTTNALNARDAEVTVNNVTATSATNTFDGVIPGGSITVTKEDALKSISVQVTRDNSGVKDKITQFIDAYNSLNGFLKTQLSSTADSSIGRDSVVRSLRSSLSRVLGESRSVGGQFSTLAEVGIEFTRTGELSLNETAFNAAVSDHPADVDKLLSGTSGVFAAFGSTIAQYTDANGILVDAQSRIDTQLDQISKRIDDLDARLEIKRASLQQEFTAADLAISSLNQQGSQLNNLGSQYRLF